MSAGNSKNDKPANEPIGPMIQIGDSGSNTDQVHQSPSSGGFPNLLFAAVQSNGPNSGQNSPSGGSYPAYPSLPSGSNLNPNQQSFNPSHWPGAPEPFQIVQPPVGAQQEPDFKGFDPLGKSPYHELLKSLASTAPIFPPEPLVAQNPSGPQVFMGNNVVEGGGGPFPGDGDKLEPPGPPRSPLNIDNANYLTAVASIPTRLGPPTSQQAKGNSMIFPGASVYQGQLISSPDIQPKISSGGGPFQGSNSAPPPPFPFPSPPVKSPSQNNGPPPNPNQFIYTHSGNQFPITKNFNAKPAQNQAFPQQQQNAQYSPGVYVRAQQQATQVLNNNNVHNRQHPSNQSFGGVNPDPHSLSSQPKLNPFTVQVGDILGFPPGTPFSAVPAGLPSGSRLNKDGAAFQVLSGRAPLVPVEVNPYRKVYSELPAPNTRPTPSIIKPSSYEKSEEIMKENKRTFSMVQ